MRPHIQLKLLCVCVRKTEEERNRKKERKRGRGGREGGEGRVGQPTVPLVTQTFSQDCSSVRTTGNGHCR